MEADSDRKEFQGILKPTLPPGSAVVYGYGSYAVPWHTTESSSYFYAFVLGSAETQAYGKQIAAGKAADGQGVCTDLSKNQ